MFRRHRRAYRALHWLEAYNQLCFFARSSCFARKSVPHFLAWQAVLTSEPQTLSPSSRSTNTWLGAQQTAPRHTCMASNKRPLNAPTQKSSSEGRPKKKNTYEAHTPGDVGVAALIHKPLLRPPCQRRNSRQGARRTAAAAAAAWSSAVAAAAAAAACSPSAPLCPVPDAVHEDAGAVLSSLVEAAIHIPREHELCA